MKTATKVLSVTCAAILVSFATGNVEGAILYATDFNSAAAGHSGDFSGSANYSDGAIIGQDSWAITGTSTVNPINVANTATNGNVTLTTTGQDVNRVFSPAVTTGSVFLSADINVASAQATGDYFLHLGDGGSSNFYDRVYVRSSGAGFQMALATSSGTPTYGSTVLNLSQVYHIVAQYDFVVGATNDTASLYVNPTDPIYGGDNLYVAGTTIGIDAASISSANLRQGTATSAPGVTVDNIAVAVPEPTTLVLMGLGLIGMIGAARYRRAG